ncbi:MAG: methyltransferase domain-containing protein [Dehalococcoidia bacterium]
MSADAASNGVRRLRPNELRGYWSRLSSRFLADDPEGLAVICYAGMPAWFNGFLDRYQRVAFARLTRDVDIAGKRVLDIGTGVGRWARVFVERGAAEVVGIDLDRPRLAAARSRTAGDAAGFKQMSIEHLAFGPESFDIVNSVTVLQHVDHDTKRRALKEVARVLRPGGRAVLFELTDMSDDAPHVFPARAEEWTSMCRDAGLEVKRTTGDQYMPLIRLGKAALSRGRIDGFKSGGPRQNGLRPAALALRALVLLSYPVEEVCRRLLPASAARISGFLLRKAEPLPSFQRDATPRRAAA